MLTIAGNSTNGMLYFMVMLYVMLAFACMLMRLPLFSLCLFVALTAHTELCGTPVSIESCA